MTHMQLKEAGPGGESQHSAELLENVGDAQGGCQLAAPSFPQHVWQWHVRCGCSMTCARLPVYEYRHMKGC